MNPKSHYLIQVLEKIGTPLMASIVEVSASAGADAVAEDAQRMAELLARTTQASIEIAGIISPASATQDDAFRLSLAALLAPIVADHYRYDREVPSEAKIKKITAALQTAVTFSDNFESSENNANALQTVGGTLIDHNHILQQQILALTPVVNAVGSFSFGVNEPKLISDVAERLVQKSLAMAGSWFPGADEQTRKSGALEILKSLARIYATCHQAETARLQSGGEGKLESVWQNFDLRVALIDALATNLLGTSGASAPSAPAAAQEPPPGMVADIPIASAPPPGINPLAGFAKKPTADTPPPATDTPPPAGGGGFNPMGGFAKKPADQASPPASPPAGAPPQTPESPPPASGGPMGFFKKKDDG